MSEEKHDNEFFCGICGWVPIADFAAHGHETPQSQMQIGIIGTVHPYHPGQWAATDDDTYYQVVEASIKTERRSYCYDTPVDMESAKGGGLWTKRN